MKNLRFEGGKIISMPVSDSPDVFEGVALNFLDGNDNLKFKKQAVREKKTPIVYLARDLSPAILGVMVESVDGGSPSDVGAILSVNRWGLLSHASLVAREVMLQKGEWGKNVIVAVQFDKSILEVIKDGDGVRVEVSRSPNFTLTLTKIG